MGRLAIGLEFEASVLKALRKRGWSAFEFGSGLLPNDLREVLKRYEDDCGRPALVRWLPDILATRDRADGRVQVVAIDVKCCAHAIENYTIEANAIEVAGVIADRLYTPTYFVVGSVEDARVLTTRAARLGWLGPGTDEGSNTPYYIVPKRLARPFVDVFGPLPEVTS